MKDQIDKLDDLGVDAAQVNSAVPAREAADAMERIESERSQLVLTTPERLGNPDFLARLAAQKIDLFVVDEGLGRPPILALGCRTASHLAHGTLAHGTLAPGISHPAPCTPYRPRLTGIVRCTHGSSG